MGKYLVLTAVLALGAATVGAAPLNQARHKTTAAVTRHQHTRMTEAQRQERAAEAVTQRWIAEEWQYAKV